jgi:hypothetical protein
LSGSRRSSKRSSSGAAARSRSRSPRAQTETVSLEHVLEVAFRQAKGLSRTPDPIEAEQVASSLLAIWSAQEMVDQPDPAAFFAETMVTFLEARATPDALALLLGLAAVDPVRTTIEAQRAIRRLLDAGVAAPSWMGDAGRARLRSAWLAGDVYGDQDFLVGRFSYAGRAAHDLAVLVDHNVLDIAKDIAIAYASADLRTQWEHVADIVVRDLTTQEYADRVADALLNLGQTWEPPITEGARLLRPLLEARQSFLPRSRPIRRPFVSRAARDRLYAAFRRSEAGRALGRDTRLARLIIDYAADYYSDGLHWSPIVVELFLADWLPRKVSLVEDEIERLPVVLRAWLRFVAEQRDFEPRLSDELLAAVDEFADAFRHAMADDSSFGPAKSIAQQMQADGVDFSDPAAVQAWIDAFNARPFQERVELTGGPSGRSLP